MTLDPNQMAAAEFAPQFAALMAAQKATQGRYAKAGTDTQGMYSALAKAIQGQVPGVQKTYADSGKQIGAAYNNAIAQTNNAFGDTRSGVSELANRLGVGSALPTVNRESQDMQGRLAGLLASNSQNSQNTNTLLGNNDVAYTKDTANTTRLAGNNAMDSLRQKLIDAMSGFDQQRLGLTSQENQAENSYAMSIQKMNQEAELARQKMAADATNTAASNEYRQAQLALEASRLGLDTDKFKASLNKPADAPKLTPMENFTDVANRIYQGNSNAAKNAMNAVTDTLERGFNGNTHFNNVSDFVSAVVARNSRNGVPAAGIDLLKTLAYEFYRTAAGDNSKPYG